MSAFTEKVKQGVDPGVFYNIIKWNKDSFLNSVIMPACVALVLNS